MTNIKERAEKWSYAVMAKDADVDSLTNQLENITEEAHQIWCDVFYNPEINWIHTETREPLTDDDKEKFHPLTTLIYPYLNAIRSQMESDGVEIPSEPPSATSHDLVKFYLNSSGFDDHIAPLLSFSSMVKILCEKKKGGTDAQD